MCRAVAPGGAGKYRSVNGHGHNVVSMQQKGLGQWAEPRSPIASENRSVLPFRILGCAFLIGMAPAIAQSQTDSTRTGDQVTSSSLAPGDFIALSIWREPDLSDTVQVDNSGMAVFPKLGPIKVTDMGADSLERRLVRQYGEYLQNPSIRVIVLRRITVWGAVARPGTYPVDLTMSVTDALALAGGPNQAGKLNQVELRRGTSHTKIDLSKGAPSLDDVSLRSGDQLYVPERSWASRNLGLVLGAVGTATSLIYLVVR